MLSASSHAIFYIHRPYNIEHYPRVYRFKIKNSTFKKKSIFRSKIINNNNFWSTKSKVIETFYVSKSFNSNRFLCKMKLLLF